MEYENFVFILFLATLFSGVFFWLLASNKKPIPNLFGLFFFTFAMCDLIGLLILTGEKMTDSKSLDVAILVCSVIVFMYVNYNFILDNFGLTRTKVITRLKISSDISVDKGGHILESEDRQKFKFILQGNDLASWVADHHFDDNYDSYVSDLYELEILPHTRYILSAVKTGK